MEGREEGDRKRENLGQRKERENEADRDGSHKGTQVLQRAVYSNPGFSPCVVLNYATSSPAWFLLCKMGLKLAALRRVR